MVCINVDDLSIDVSDQDKLYSTVVVTGGAMNAGTSRGQTETRLNSLDFLLLCVCAFAAERMDVSSWTC